MCSQQPAAAGSVLADHITGRQPPKGTIKLNAKKKETNQLKVQPGEALEKQCLFVWEKIKQHLIEFSLHLLVNTKVSNCPVQRGKSVMG